MAALRSLLLGCFVALVNGDASGLETFIDMVNATYTSVVIMEACPIGTEVLIPCCVLLGLASAGMALHKQPSEKGRAARGCCFTGFVFLILLFAPVMAHFISQDPSCVDAKPYEFDLLVQIILIALIVAFFLVTAALAGCNGKGIRRLGGFVHDKAKRCCSCAKPPNDNGLANMSVFLLCFAMFGVFAIPFVAVFKDLALATKIAVCLAEIVIAAIFYFVGGFKVFSEWTESVNQNMKLARAGEERTEPLLG